MTGLREAGSRLYASLLSQALLIWALSLPPANIYGFVKEVTTAMLRYCLNASTIRTTPILEQIAATAEAGYEGIELWHDAIDAFLETGGTLATIRHALDDAGLAVPTTIYIAGWFDASDDEYPGVLAECKRRMAQSVELGAPHIIAGPPPGQADINVGARRYRELLELGVSMGVHPAMEFLGFVGQYNTIESAMDVMQRSEHGAATTVLDPFHIFRGGGSMDSIAKLQSHQIAVSHFNDTPSTPARVEQHDKDRVMPGEGHLDLKRYVELLTATGYDRFLSLELFREELWQQDPRKVAKRGLELMTSVVEG